MRLSKKIYIVMVLCLCFGALSFYLVKETRYFLVDETQFTLEASHLHGRLQADISKHAKDKLKTIEGKSIWSLSLEKLRENILSDVWIDSVVIEREFPQKIRVRAHAKSIFFIYIDGKGRVYPVTEKGQLLNPITLAESPDVPILRNPEIVKNSETLSKVIALYRAIPVDGELNQKDIAEIDWSPLSGLKVELVRGDEGLIVLGLSDVRGKIKRITSVLKYLESQNQKWRVIDASFSKKVLVRLRKHS